MQKNTQKSMNTKRQNTITKKIQKMEKMQENQKDEKMGKKIIKMQ